MDMWGKGTEVMRRSCVGAMEDNMKGQMVVDFSKDGNGCGEHMLQEEGAT